MHKVSRQGFLLTVYAPYPRPIRGGELSYLATQGCCRPQPLSCSGLHGLALPSKHAAAKWNLVVVTETMVYSTQAAAADCKNVYVPPPKFYDSPDVSHRYLWSSPAEERTPGNGSGNVCHCSSSYSRRMHGTRQRPCLHQGTYNQLLACTSSPNLFRHGAGA